jgi:tryptophanyl-tRNA synthetase
MAWGAFKPLLADALCDHLSGIQGRYAEIVAEEAFLREVLAAGARSASGVASGTMDRAKTAMGFQLP